MTSEVEALKTNEFLRRRKLRIQQVREQSKDIAKKLRHRANAEKFKHLVDLDSTKGKVYLDEQEKLIRKLEFLRAKSNTNFGASHRNAVEVLQENKPEKVDLSKQRAREAAAELRQKKQLQLDERKKFLDRRLQARETANEISREKSSFVISKLSKTSQNSSDNQEQAEIPAPEAASEQISTKENCNTDVIRSDMATQCDDALPDEWQPHVPSLVLPKNDNPLDSGYKNPESEAEKSKRPNLFALSDEMPFSLRGGSVSSGQPIERMTKNSLNLVSEFIKNRDLRLRDYDVGVSSKRPNDELQSIKQTIQRIRVSKVPGSVANTVHVADVQVFPVPSWRAEVNCSACTQRNTNQPSIKHTPTKYSPPKPRKTVKSATNSDINCQCTCSPNRARQNHILPTPVLRGSSPFRRTKVYPGAFSGKPVQEKAHHHRADSTEIHLEKKNSVTMYNHSTRDVKDIPYEDKKLVTRDRTSKEDAYAEAMKEASFERMSDEKDHQKKMQDMRNKAAMTKQNIEKEFNDTMSFLKSLPKDKSKPIKNAYKDDFQQELQKELRQKKLQYEFKKVQKQCSKHSQTKKVPIRPKLKVRNASDEDFNAQDSQYSWMPVPESDGGLAIHIIPTMVKENKCGNSVRFSKIDSYHEYRSRHKHTPPTKDTCETEKIKNVESDISESQSSASSDGDTSSVEDLRQNESKPRKIDNQGSDAERIIVYKVLKSKPGKKKKSSKIDIAKSLSFISKECQAGQNKGEVGDHKTNVPENQDNNPMISKSNSGNREVPDKIMSFEQIQEGVYKTVSENGKNVSATRICDPTPQKNTFKADVNTVNVHQQNNVDRVCEKSIGESGDINARKTPTTPSSLSYKPTPGAKTQTPINNRLYDKSTVVDKSDSNGAFLQLVDDKGQESGKFYIGATGLLKNDNYEVLIQVRKTDKKETKPEAKQASHIENAQPVSTGTSSLDKEANTITTQENLHYTAEENVILINEFDAVQPVVHRYQSPRFVDRSVDVPFQDSESAQPAVQMYQSPRFVDRSVDVPFQDSESAQPAVQIYQSPRFVDRSVDVPFQDCLEATTNFSPTLSESKQANSVSVQTPNDSSGPRPAFFRMSSSTSTTYLSPPESVLPQFLKRSRRKSRKDDFYFPFTRSYRMRQNNKTEVSVTKHSSPNRNIKTKRPITPLAPSSVSPKAKIKAPPNTARSTISNKSHHANKRKKSKSKITVKCAKHDSLDYFKTYTNKVKKAQPLVPPPSRASEKSLSDKGCLTPIIKWYVDKLLAMNKEGMRTIEVMNQDCSEVTTPGSSIVDVACNVQNDKREVNARISLEQIKFAIAKNVLEQYEKFGNETNSIQKEARGKNISKFSLRFSRNKSVHKVKSLNISRSLLQKNKLSANQKSTEILAPASSDNFYNSEKTIFNCQRSKSSPSSSHSISKKIPRKTGSSDGVNVKSSLKSCVLNDNDNEHHNNVSSSDPDTKTSKKESIKKIYPAKVTDVKSLEPESNGTSQTLPLHTPLHTSTQTNIVVIDDEIKFIKEAEDKINNMEKIANLTDKCTKRLSSLAKFLEEVRKNKLPYSQVSESPSDTDLTDQTSGKNSEMAVSYEPVIEIKEKSPRVQDVSYPQESLPTQPANSHIQDVSGKQTFLPLLKDIKPIKPNPLISLAKESQKQPTSAEIHNSRLQSRSKPPPALPRCLRRTTELTIPHELSTVLEVDSPMSKHKGQTCINTNYKGDDKPIDHEKSPVISKDEIPPEIEKILTDPDVLPPRQLEETKISTDSSNDTKMKMMDLEQFNEIMLQPFITIQEYAKQCNIGNIEEGSNIENIFKDDVVNEELSSLHSDGSLPDVIAELLKRNIISEPFKFETVSNINSTSVSSDSTLSVLALSKRKTDKKLTELSLNKNNTGESSDTLSLSSNPDLENAFKKLGLGWASSTLKKTKERLALSSSSNTSSSSLSQYKFKCSKNKDFPVVVTDSITSIKNGSQSPGKQRASNGIKDSFQQTSIATSMTVKQFLTDELAKRITFGENAHDTEEQFVSLYETKMPDDMKKSNRRVFCEERSIDSNSRARTSTPVQIYKSINYHTSSSSNLSNGLFSNVEDLSSVKGTSTSFRNHSASEKDDLTVPNFSLRTKKGTSDGSKSDD